MACTGQALLDPATHLPKGVLQLQLPVAGLGEDGLPQRVHVVHLLTGGGGLGPSFTGDHLLAGIVHRVYAGLVGPNVVHQDLGRDEKRGQFELGGYS